MLELLRHHFNVRRVVSFAFLGLLKPASRLHKLCKFLFSVFIFGLISRFQLPPEEHERRYNAPTTNEVALLMVESERLSFIRRNQKKLRTENYIHLQDALRADENLANIGQIVILPSSFTGGPRYLHERTQDAMTYVPYAQVSKIFSLRAIKNPSAKCLHEFMDVCNEAIRNLETLEFKRNQLVDVILVHFLQQKLSENLRTYPVAITADIEKMYRQIRIHPEDADYQRILWRPSPEEPVVDNRLLTWRLARILEVYPGSDQKVRVAQVRAATGVYLRPITKLAPLPFKSEPGFSGRGEYVPALNMQN
ncbi:hypothetical protein LAZ67_19001334 [Cordylochernes scorpioides]|uniref:Uncharacterized protein n=1 Tax=Cordylochernes scorpioides TaxID=51811 RepID=A0ABY6LMB6_9ARAC|nr:hypothetical protein LAZ67_19001334 [Cordylochernes scorpioides]